MESAFQFTNPALSGLEFWINKNFNGEKDTKIQIRMNMSVKVAKKENLNEAILKAKDADGFVFGSPVHYAAASGAITSFLDRLFYAGYPMAHKPGAAVVSCRRGGATAALDQLNKYFTIAQMPVVSSNYWNMVHGNTPEEVCQDKEGLQTMRILGRNMAWMLKCIEAGKNNGVAVPEAEAKVKTNYIR